MLMKKFFSFAVAVLVSIFAMAQAADYTSVTLSAEEIDIDNGESIGLVVAGELSATDQMYAQFGYVVNMLTNAYLYEEGDTEGTKLSSVMASWDKSLVFGDDTNLKAGTSYKLVIKMGGLSTMSYYSGATVLENKSEIELSFKTKVARTDAFIKKADFNIYDYYTIDLDDESFTGINITVDAKNLPTVGAYCVYMGGVRLYDLDDPDEKYTFLSVNQAVSAGNVITLCSPEKLAKSKNYKLVIPFEGLYVHNYFDMTKEVCYFSPASLEFYTAYETPSTEINATVTLGETSFTIANADTEQNMYAAVINKSYLGNMTVEEYFTKRYLSYAGRNNLETGTIEASYQEWWANYAGEYCVVVCGAEYDAVREGCYATTLPKIVEFSVDENGNIIVPVPEYDEIVLDAVDPDISKDEAWMIYDNEDYKVYIDIVKNLPLSADKAYTIDDLDKSYSYIYNKKEPIVNQYGTKTWKKYNYTSAEIKIGENNVLEAIIKAEGEDGEGVIEAKFVYTAPEVVEVELNGTCEFIPQFGYAFTAKNSDVNADYGFSLLVNEDSYSKGAYTIDDLGKNGNTIKVAKTEYKIAAADLELTVDGDTQVLYGEVQDANGKKFIVRIHTNVPSAEEQDVEIDLGNNLVISEDEGDIKFKLENGEHQFIGYISYPSTDVPTGTYNLLSYSKYGDYDSNIGFYMSDQFEEGKLQVTNNDGAISITATFKQNNKSYVVTGAKAVVTDITGVDAAVNEKAYDLNGRLVNPATAKGIIIINGVKVIR